jgi:hypothetical protein
MSRKRKLVLVGAVVLGGAGAGAALAAGGGVRHHAPAARPANAVAAPFAIHAGFRGFGLGFGFGGVLQAASSYLGVSVSTLMGDLRSGGSLADVANATSGKSEAGLVDAVVASVKAQLDKAVSAGKLSSDQESKLEANLSQRVTAFVEAKRPAVGAMPPRAFGFGFGFGRHGGRGAPPGGANA